jgi:hypothetical protein
VAGDGGGVAQARVRRGGGEAVIAYYQDTIVVEPEVFESADRPVFFPLPPHPPIFLCVILRTTAA